MTITAIRSRRGKWIHAAAYGTHGGGKTVCGRAFSGWLIAESDHADEPEDLISCPNCIARIRS